MLNARVMKKRYYFLLRRMYFTGDSASQNLLVLALIISSLILNSNKKVTNWISTERKSEKIKPFDTNRKRTMYNLANGRVILIFVNSVFA